MAAARGMPIVLTVLTTLAAGKVYDRCELARELLDVHEIPAHQVPTWVCLARHESEYNTAAFNPGSGDHGLFQISELFWCSPSGYACGVSCEDLRNDDIEDDVICARRIYREHKRLSGDGFNAWVVYNLYCKDPYYVDSLMDGCFSEETRLRKTNLSMEVTPEPTTTTYKPITITHQPSTAKYKPTTITYKPPTTTRKPPTTIYKPSTTTHRPKTTTYKPRVTTYKSRISTFKPWTTNYKAPTTTRKPWITTKRYQTTTRKTAPWWSTTPKPTTKRVVLKTTKSPFATTKRPTSHNKYTTTMAQDYTYTIRKTGFVFTRTSLR